MDIAQVLKTALVFERKVGKMYARAAEKAADPKGKRFLEIMAREEASHVDYLESRAAEFSRDGRITAPALKTVLPDPARIRKGAAALRRTMNGTRATAGRGEITLLSRVVRAEEEVTAFYRATVAEAGGEARKLFARFLEIEEGHTTLAQAELDAVSGLGFWADIREFDLEAA